LGLNWALTIGALVSVLLGGAVVGYFFSGRINNGEKEIIFKVSVFFYSFNAIFNCAKKRSSWRTLQ